MKEVTKDLRVLNYHAVSLVYAFKARQRGGSVDRGPLNTRTFEAAFSLFIQNAKNLISSRDESIQRVYTYNIYIVRKLSLYI